MIIPKDDHSSCLSIHLLVFHLLIILFNYPKARLLVTLFTYGFALGFRVTTPVLGSESVLEDC